MDDVTRSFDTYARVSWDDWASMDASLFAAKFATDNFYESIRKPANPLGNFDRCRGPHGFKCCTNSAVNSVPHRSIDHGTGATSAFGKLAPNPPVVFD
jgi:hypothetical protein